MATDDGEGGGGGGGGGLSGWRRRWRRVTASFSPLKASEIITLSVGGADVKCGGNDSTIREAGVGFHFHRFCAR